jgi:hypothetical protein
VIHLVSGERSIAPYDHCDARALRCEVIAVEKNETSGLDHEEVVTRPASDVDLFNQKLV